MPFRPFDYGNVLAQSAGIQSNRMQNLLAQARYGQVMGEMEREEAFRNVLARNPQAAYDELAGIDPTRAAQHSQNMAAAQMAPLQLQAAQQQVAAGESAAAQVQREEQLQQFQVFGKVLESIDGALEKSPEAGMQMAQFQLERLRQIPGFVPDDFVLPDNPEDLRALVAEQRAAIEPFIRPRMAGLMSGGQLNASTGGAFLPNDALVFVGEDGKPQIIDEGYSARMADRRNQDLSREAPAAAAIHTQYDALSNAFVQTQGAMGRLEGAWEFIESLGDDEVTSAADTALVLNVARMMQPGMRGISGDAQEDVANLSGISKLLGQAWERLGKDNSLTPAQRRSIMRLGRDFYAREAANQKQINRRFESRAADVGVRFRPIPMEIPRPDPEALQLLLMEGDETFNAMQGNPVFDAGDLAL